MHISITSPPLGPQKTKNCSLRSNRCIQRKGLTHHCDKGCQYTSDDFKSLMQKEKAELSMSGTGHCYDIAVAESFFHVLKTEHVNLCTFRTREEAKNSIFEYIEVFYNRERIHTTLRYLSPVEYEILWSNKQFSYSQRPKKRCNITLRKVSY